MRIVVIFVPGAKPPLYRISWAAYIRRRDLPHLNRQRTHRAPLRLRSRRRLTDRQARAGHWGGEHDRKREASCTREWAGSGSDAIADPEVTAVRNQYGVTGH
jgi:hypothetical protein